MKRLKPKAAVAYLALLIAGLAPLSAPSAAAEPTRRPNVIVLLTDDNGYGDLACHGNPVLKTPNFDRLHDQSVRLTDFHVAPMCTPTRGQLMTGKDALHNGATSVCAGRSCLRNGIPTMAENFAASGYRTAMFGKWHLGDSYPNLPHQRGFQEAVYHLGWGITSMADAETWQNDYFNGRFFHNGTLKQYKGYCTDIWFDLAMDWIKRGEGTRRNGADRQPFFLYLPTNAAHGPLWVADKYKTPYQGKGPAAFFGMIANLDENLGRLDAFLQTNGLMNDTLLIYLNDNGGTAGVQVYNAGMRGRKTQYYEGGHRAAGFFRWPAGGLRPPVDVDALTEVQDLLPTLIDLCALTSPAGASYDGTSLAGLLRGTTEALPDRTLVVQYGQNPAQWDSAVMWRKWRLVHGKELYDLATDPGQKNDVAAQHADVVARLRSHYESWWAGVAPQLDDFMPVVLGSDRQNPVTLSSADWANIYCDNSNDLRSGKRTNGPWYVIADRDGTYEIALSRWPKEANAPIAGPVPAFKAVAGSLPPGVALPIARARLKVADVDESKPVNPNDTAVTFTVKLKAGTKMPLQSWFLDADGKEICGAYFADVRRK